MMTETVPQSDSDRYDAETYSEAKFFYEYFYFSPTRSIFNFFKRDLHKLRWIRAFCMLANFGLSLFMLMWAGTLATETTLHSLHQERLYDIWGIFVNITTIYFVYLWQPHAIYNTLSTLKLNQKSSQSLIERYLKFVQKHIRWHVICAIPVALVFVGHTIYSGINPPLYPGYTEHWWETHPIVTALYVVLTIIPAYLVVAMLAQHLLFSSFFVQNIRAGIIRIQYSASDLGLGAIKAYYNRVTLVVIIVGIYITLRAIPTLQFLLEPIPSLQILIHYITPFILNLIALVVCIYIPLQWIENLIKKDYAKKKEAIITELDTQVDELRRLIESENQFEKYKIEPTKNLVYVLNEKKNIINGYDVEWYSPLRQFVATIFASLFALLLSFADLVELFDFVQGWFE